MPSLQSVRHLRYSRSRFGETRVRWRYFALSVALAASSTQFAEASAPSEASVIRGAVFDSLHRVPLAGASIQLAAIDNGVVAQSFHAVSNARGEFEVLSAPRGTYLIAVSHPMLDSLGVEVPERTVVHRGELTNVKLAVPGVRSLAQRLCRTSTPSTGLILGRVTSERADSYFEGATVSASWTTFPSNIYRPQDVSLQEARVTTQSGGWFAFCGAPADVAIWLSAGYGVDSSASIPVVVAADDLRQVTLRVGANHLRTEVNGGQENLLRFGRSRFTGWVVSEQGVEVPNARIAFLGTGREVSVSRSGTFFVDSLPGGSQLVEVRALGYAPRSYEISLISDTVISTKLTLGPRTTRLGAVDIRATKFDEDIGGFERRRKSASSQAHFYASDALQMKAGLTLSAIVGEIRGVDRRCGTGGCELWMRTRNGTTWCRAQLYVDGFRDLSGAFDYLVSEDLAGVEVYSDDRDLPSQFVDLTLREPCGAVVVWRRVH